MDIEGEQITVLKEGVHVAFYMPGFHQEVAPAVMQSLERYLHALGPASLGWYVDNDGYWWSLSDKDEGFLRNQLMDPRGARIEARGRPDSVTGIGFSYVGHAFVTPLFAQNYPQAMCAVEFWLPTEFLEEQGAEAAHALTIELGRGLPFSSGHAGLSFETWGWMEATTPVLRESSLRHPGFDLPRPSALEMYLGSRRVRGPSWLNFLGPPILEELGGAEGLRARLHSPSTEVQALSLERAVVSLGREPEAGDLETGDTLPHYRELASVLEPWLYEHQGSWGALTKEEVRRWERRFL
ncbi:type VI immunity family protein [Corallococcus sp. CA053C]|uniref:type VI immunity family protein n=1 Tax=Corallococcus sp. CA053C TaxID=2316732 RepID=UPI001F398BC4|nr:type VI immunity family protein [Corallococcus sp. CA053C]